MTIYVHLDKHNFLNYKIIILMYTNIIHFWKAIGA